MNPIQFANILREAADKITALKGYPSIVTTKAQPEFRYFQRNGIKYKVQTDNPSSCIHNQRNSGKKWVESIMTLDDMLGDWGDSTKPIEYLPSKGENGPASKSEEIQATNQNPSKPIPAPSLPDPPEGFHPAMMGPLKVQAKKPTSDILMWQDGIWKDLRWNGNSTIPYALRIGSEISRLNGLELTLELGRTYATNAGEIVTVFDTCIGHVWNSIGQALINGVAQPLDHPDSIREEIPAELLPLPKLPNGFKEWRWRGYAWKSKNTMHAFRFIKAQWDVYGDWGDATGGFGYYLEAIPCAPDDVFGPEAIPADKEPDHVESDHPECKDGCQYAFETGVWPNRVCPIGECQHCNRKPEPAKRREWEINHDGLSTYPVAIPVPFDQKRIESGSPRMAREVLPGDPSPEEVEELVRTLQNAFAFRVSNHPVWEAEARKALQPFTKNQSK